MKKIYLNLCNSLVVITLIMTSLYSQSVNGWLSNKEAMVVAGGVLAFASITYCAHTGALKYHEKEVNRVRLTLHPDDSIHYGKVVSNEGDEAIKMVLARRKEELRKKWIFRYHHGLTLSGSVKFSGDMSAANVYCWSLGLYGNGFLKNSIVSSETIIDGNFIINGSRLNSVVIIEGNSDFVSFDKCLLNDVKQNGSNSTTIELNDTVVGGDIIFKEPGSVILDSKSVIGGSVVNGKLVKN